MWERKTLLLPPKRSIHRPLLHPTPPLPPSSWGPRPSAYPEVLGLRWVSVVTALRGAPCGHLLRCGLVEERGAWTVRWSSQSDDLSGSPAQLESRAPAPPKRGRGPGCAGSHQPTPPSLPMSISLLPGPRSSRAGPQATRENSARPPPLGPDTGGFVHGFPRGPGRDPAAQTLSPASDLALCLCRWRWLPGREAGQTGSRLSSG